MYDRLKRDKQRLELIGEFPRIFGGALPRVGFGTNAGWDRILRRLFANIDRLLTDEQVERFEILRIKEKFGDLQVHCSISDPTFEFPREALNALVANAVAEAQVTCDQCSQPATSGRKKSGWIVVRCDACKQASEATS